ncbi:MAG TPA: hypothetical protein VH062_10045 [Polyangiaceae bacterium]|jgi:hypothetical protein|nr:hypothetical protein [Polyangiaceae bacterium]
MRTSRAAVAAVVLFAAHDAAAQATSVATARQLALTGIDAVEAHDCEKGAPLLERAEQLHHASVHLQYLARCRVASGRLVAATEMWRRIIRDGAPEGASPAVVSALSEARTELEKTLPRLAQTTIRTARDYPGLSLTIDGNKVPSDMVGTPQILDPGDHELAVSATGYESWSRKWTLADGGTAELTVELTALPEGQTAPLQEGHTEPKKKSSFLGPAGWITASVGAASLIAGTVTLLARNNRRSDMESKCTPDGSCPRSSFQGNSFDDDRSAIGDLTTASNVLLWGGGALLAGGATMIVVASQGSSKEPGTALLVGAPRATAGLTVQGRW